MADDNTLIAELLQEDVSMLVKYDIRGEKMDKLKM